MYFSNRSFFIRELNLVYLDVLLLYKEKGVAGDFPYIEGITSGRETLMSYANMHSHHVEVHFAAAIATILPGPFG